VPGPRRWGEPLVTRGELAPASELPYVVDRIPPPGDNPFNALFFLAGLDFFTGGDAAVCTAHGDVWIVRGLDGSLEKVTWQRFATGLYQPLGLEVVDDHVIVLGRDQLTRLHDENGDGEADFYESFNHDLVDYGMPHAYAMRLERMPDGSFIFLKAGDGPHGSALLRLSAGGERLEVVARGFRHPFGMGAGPLGEITVADSEGNWVPSSKIDLIQPGGFYGFLGTAALQGESPSPLRPLCFIPKVADNSCGGQFWHTSASWGPYHRGGMFHFSWGRCTLHAVLPQQVADQWQAATVEIPGVVLQSGPAEAEFHPRDGQLYVVGLDGWQTGAQADGSFERIRYSGKPVHLPGRFAAHADGILLDFDEPIDPACLQSGDAIRVEQWNYRWSSTYGSYHYSAADPKRVGHDVVKVKQANLSDDGKQLFVQIDGLRPVDQIQLALNLRTMVGAAVKCNVYGTITALAAPHEAPKTRQLEQLLDKENLVAWCIVPFDSRKRGPEERASMLEQLGIRRVAYDWRAEHVATFDEELEAYERHGVVLHAFWMPVDTDTPLKEQHWPIVLDLVRRHRVAPELWVMLNNALVENLPETDRPKRAAEILAPVARGAAEHGCRIGFYNHGAWWGQPDNQIRVLKLLQDSKIDNVGLVYNFHHGHEHVADFRELARRMQPYLLTVNINGMRDGGPQILQIARGNHERTMLRDLVAAGYAGPIGILHHRDGYDAEQGLKENLLGIDQLLEKR
jgi:sugar phosphate isomerase/epimerase